MEDQVSYVKEEIKISLLWANLIALVSLVVSFIVFGFIFLVINEKNTSLNISELSKLIFIWKSKYSYIIFIVITILGLLVHEFIHGATWSLFTKKGFKSIKFGILWKTCTPYCSCKETLNKNYYQLGAIMPLLILGVVPLILANLFGSKVLFLFSIIFINVAIGDILAFSKLYKEKSDTFISDHPSAVGWYIYRKKIVD